MSSSTARRKSAPKRLPRITTSVRRGAQHFNDDHVGLFDDVLCQLIAEIETKARAELSRRMAPIANAPTELVRRLAHDDDISVAGPVLEQSPRLAETDLVDIAETKGQAHLLAISGRARKSARPSPTFWCGAAITKSCAASPTTRAQAFQERLLGTGQSRGGRRRAGREGRASGPTFRRICSANC